VRIELESPELFNPLNSSTSQPSQFFNFSTFKLFNFSTLGKEINTASNFEISMADTLNLIKDIIQSDVSLVTDEQRLRPKDSEVFRLWGDNSLMKSLTDWRPEYNIQKGLEETVNWFLKGENIKKYKAGIYNL
jgi:nucleoside-diphosphate-sugar epimerase